MPTAAAAMIDRLVHHAEVVALKGDSYRIKDRDLGRVPTVTADDQLNPAGQFSIAATTSSPNASPWHDPDRLIQGV